MPDDWLTLADARGRIIAARRCNHQEAASELETELAEGRRTAHGHRVAAGKYRTESEKGPDGKIVRYVEIEIEPVGTPAPGQAKEAIPQHWWVKAAGASVVTEVSVLYEKNEVQASLWECAYVNVHVGPLVESSQKVSNNKGGRPARFDITDMYLEAFRVLYIGEVKDAGQMRARLRDWYATNYKAQLTEKYLNETLIAQVIRKLRGTPDIDLPG